jgi:predicted amidohydrolase YtcJ
MPKTVVGAVLALLLLALPAPAAQRREADLVFRNGAVYTMDAVRSWASAVAVADGRVVYVGTDKGADAWTGPRTKVVELGGKMLLPGFEDSHVHPVEGGVDLGRCVLGDFTTEKQILDAVADYAAKNPTKPWVLGAGWQLPVFKDADPSKALLDAIVPDRPVFLDAADGHSAWVNSKALAIAGVTKATPDPPNGRIERDPATGEPSGTLREAAKGLVSSKIPPPSPEDRVEGLRRALAMANRFGITSLMEANADAKDLDAYAELDRRGELTARVLAALDTDAGRGVAQGAGPVARRRK